MFFLNLLQNFFFMFCFFDHEACGILAPWSGIKLATPALEDEVLTIGPPGNPSSFQSSLRRSLFRVGLPYLSIYSFKFPVGHCPLPVFPSALCFILMSLGSIPFWLTAWLISHLPSSPIECKLQEYRAFISFVNHCEIPQCLKKKKKISTK